MYLAGVYMQILEFYSDGSSDNVKAKNAGWASVFMHEGRKPLIIYGHLETPSTNNHGELIGIMGCAYLLKKMELSTGKRFPARIVSDSEYAIGCLDPKSTWLPSKNQDIIHPGNLLLNKCSSIITFKWVKGHKGVEGNELADKYSRYGRLQQVMNDPRYVTRYYSSKAEIMTVFNNFLKELTDGHEIC